MTIADVILAQPTALGFLARERTTGLKCPLPLKTRKALKSGRRPTGSTVRRSAFGDRHSQPHSPDRRQVEITEQNESRLVA